MSDSLRDRIAAVLDKHYPQTTGYHDELTDWCQCGLPRAHVADAVIEAIASHECREVRSKTSRDDDDDPYEAKADAARQEWAEPYQPDTNQHTLRDRIAAALFNVDNGGIVAYLETDEPEILDTDRVIDGTINFAELADAVIAALGLERQAHYDTDCRYHRYVTEWETDDV